MKTLLNIEVPLFVYLNNNKKWYLNLNTYQRTNYFTLSKVKKIYSEIVRKQVIDCNLYIDYAVDMQITVHPRSKRAFDLDNMCVFSKFVCDALTQHKILKDDNYNIINSITLKVGCLDKNNPRCSLNFLKVTQMKSLVIQITEDDLIEKMKEYFSQQLNTDVELVVVKNNEKIEESKSIKEVKEVKETKQTKEVKKKPKKIAEKVVENVIEEDDNDLDSLLDSLEEDITESETAIESESLEEIENEIDGGLELFEFDGDEEIDLDSLFDSDE